MPEDMRIRRASEDDVPAITRIYNYAILNTTATFDIEPKTLENRLEWFRKHDDNYPLIVATIDDKVVGWASIRPFGVRAAYRFTVENAVYIDCEYQGRGIGATLLAELIRLSTELEYHVILATVVGGNDASLKLHLKFGFEQVGITREVGRKFGLWLDVIYLERILSGRD
ncbi:MAG: GNAT family N-acetyltransferase [Armatimonadota bacterium]